MDTLKAGESLGVEQQLTSGNGSDSLKMQADGNLVLYSGSDGAVWSSDTTGSGAVRATMQEDGNFVLYTATGTAVWSSGTDGHAGSMFTITYGRDLNIAAPDGTVIWASNTGTGATPPAAEAPVVEAAPAAAAPAMQTYTVADGDTLWAIAERFYGDGNQYQKIANASGIANPDEINAGQVLTIPA